MRSQDQDSKPGQLTTPLPPIPAALPSQNPLTERHLIEKLSMATILSALISDGYPTSYFFDIALRINPDFKIDQKIGGDASAIEFLKTSSFVDFLNASSQLKIGMRGIEKLVSATLDPEYLKLVESIERIDYQLPLNPEREALSILMSTKMSARDLILIIDHPQFRDFNKKLESLYGGSPTLQIGKSINAYLDPAEQEMLLSQKYQEAFKYTRQTMEGVIPAGINDVWEEHRLVDEMFSMARKSVGWQTRYRRDFEFENALKPGSIPVEAINGTKGYQFPKEEEHRIFSLSNPEFVKERGWLDIQPEVRFQAQFARLLKNEYGTPFTHQSFPISTDPEQWRDLVDPDMKRIYLELITKYATPISTIGRVNQSEFDLRKNIKNVLIALGGDNILEATDYRERLNSIDQFLRLFGASLNDPPMINDRRIRLDASQHNSPEVIKLGDKFLNQRQGNTKPTIDEINHFVRNR